MPPVDELSWRSDPDWVADARDTAAKVVDVLVDFENRWLGESTDYFLAQAARLWVEGEVNRVLMDADAAEFRAVEHERATIDNNATAPYRLIRSMRQTVGASAFGGQVLRRVVGVGVAMIAMTTSCGGGGDGGTSTGNTGATVPATTPGWFMVADAVMKEGWDFRVIVRLGDSSANADRGRCGDTVPPGKVNQFATVEIENQSDRDAPLPNVYVSLEVDGAVVDGRWKPGPQDDCGLNPWATTFGDYSNSIMAGDTKTNSGSFSGIIEVPTSDATMTVTVNEPGVIGGGGQVFRDGVPASELGGTK